MENVTPLFVRKRQQLLKSNTVLRLVGGSCYKADFLDHISVTFYWAISKC